MSHSSACIPQRSPERGSLSRQRARSNPDLLDANAARRMQLADHISIDIRIKHRPFNDVRFLLVVTHNILQKKWVLSRSIGDYESLRTRLLKKLHHGHWCHAACPWLESYLLNKSKTTTKWWFTSRLETQREELLGMMTSIRSFASNRNNYNCRKVINVVDAFLDFTYADVEIDTKSLLQPLPNTKAVSEGDTDSNSDPSGDCDICSEEIRDSYLTTLQCGHYFHDECVLTKLNEELRCPTCGALEEEP